MAPKSTNRCREANCLDLFDNSGYLNGKPGKSRNGTTFGGAALAKIFGFSYKWSV